MRSTISVLRLAPLALLASCGLVSEPLGPENRCGSDDDCGADRCEVSLGMCVAGAPSGYRYFLEVVAPADPLTGTSATAVFGPFETGPDTTIAHDDLVLPMPVRVDGTVRAGGEPVPAVVTFVPRGRVLLSDPGRFRTTTIDPSSPDWTGVLDFALELDPNTDYDVLVEPIGESRALLPPLRLPHRIDDAGQHIAIEYPVDQLVTIIADVVDTTGAPAAGLSIRAIDPTTGQLVSSVATLADGAERPGEVRLVMHESVTGYQLRVAPEPARLYPTYVIDPTVLAVVEDPVSGERRAQILVPAAMSPVRYTGTVEYPETLADARPVPNALLTLRSTTLVDEETGMIGALETRIEADELGAFDAMILPGDYEITVVPGAIGDLGVLVESRTLMEGASPGILGHLYRVPVRTIFGGVAQAPGGEPLTGARVSASALGVPLSGIAFPDLGRRNRSNDTTTGAMGDFRLPLDVGVYDLVVEPSERSGYPWWVEPALGVGGAAVAPARIYEVRAPVVFTSRVIDGDLPIEDAQVRAFGELGEGRLIAIGRATTGADGTVRILLPPEL